VRRTIAVLILIAGGFVGGYGYGRWYAKPQAAKSARKILYYVDAMHPWYKSDKPGIAPDCGMKLVPVYEGEQPGVAAAKSLPAGAVQVTPDRQQLIGVEYGTAEYRDSAQTIRASARVTLDETRIAKVQPKLEGWISHVAVDFTGKYVSKGQPLLSIYSPEALATQQEYLLALRAQQIMHNNAMHEMGASTENLLTAARRRLELWDISDAQIETIRKTGEPLKDLTLYSPISGFVTERNAFPQQHITPDTMLYTVADLSTVWVIADVFEYEAANVRIGQSASMTLTYLPGRTFHGIVSYVLPQVDPVTRTLKVRIQLNNPGYALKPDMYGEVELHGSGRRMLTVPQTAVMNSGERQVVFIDRGNGFFEPRAVTIGQQMDGRTEILSGLAAGERIVTSGNFLIDSESRMADDRNRSSAPQAGMADDRNRSSAPQGAGHDQSHH
jgi:membrane fusion protein, copper/silver efflux system